MLRGLRNLSRTSLKSSSGKATRAGANRSYKDHELFMQITCLEMEKARKIVERQAALTRISEIDARLSGVESERVALLRQLADRGAIASQSDPAAVVPESEALAPRNAVASSPGGFRIRY